MPIGTYEEEMEHKRITKETNEKLNDIEKDLRRMQKEWIEMYETVIRLLHEK